MVIVSVLIMILSRGYIGCIEVMIVVRKVVIVIYLR